MPPKAPINIMKTLMDRFELPCLKRERSSRFAYVARTLLRTTVLAVMLIIPVALFAQELTVTGRVTDEIGQGLPGVNVIVKGTPNGTATDLDGKYIIRFSSRPESVLVISGIGYKPVEELVSQRTLIDVRLEEDITQLEEVVVTGYSTIAKKDISSSISVVDVEDMKKYASSNFAEQLLGKVPGVQVTTTSDPGSSQSIRIRGIG